MCSSDLEVLAAQHGGVYTVIRSRNQGYAPVLIRRHFINGGYVPGAVDLHGHAAGDELVVVVALRPVDDVAGHGAIFDEAVEETVEEAVEGSLEESTEEATEDAAE